MELFASRGYFFCRYCGSFHFPETAPDQGVRVLAESKEPLPCPICRTALASGLLDEAYPVHYCRGCRGVLLARGAFADVVQHRRAWATAPPAAPVLLRKEELARAVVCPKCSTRLETHPYYGPGNVVIDSCGSCDVIWLDFGELKQIVDAPGRDRGLREKAGTLRGASTQDPTTTRAIGRPVSNGAGQSGSTTDEGVDFLLDVFTDLFN